MRKIDRDFSLIRTDRRVVPSGRLWNPAADVYRSSEGWIVKVDLAGVCMEELEIEIRGQFLIRMRHQRIRGPFHHFVNVAVVEPGYASPFCIRLSRGDLEVFDPSRFFAQLKRNRNGWRVQSWVMIF